MWMRALLVVVAVLVGAQATGVLEAVEGCCAGSRDSCAGRGAPCEGDNDAGMCPPACAVCNCAQRVVEPMLTLLDAPVPRVVVADARAPFASTACRARDGFADEIAHVPIRAS